MVHAGPREEINTVGRVTRLQLPRSFMKFPLDRTHDYDLLLLRHFAKLEPMLRDFRPDLVQITGPSDVGTLGAYVAWKMGIPLAASWQTNLHQYARRRTAAALSDLPEAIAGKVADAAEHWSFRATARFYKIPRLLFAPNQEMVGVLEAATGKPCYLMSHAVDTTAFRPGHRNRPPGPFRIGYVGRLTAEKNVRLLARLEQALLDRGLRDFLFSVVGEGAEGEWLRNHMRQAEFTGVLTGEALAQTFANFDVFVFPSETDTFGLVVLEALASGVPSVVTDRGGPQFTVRQGSSGFVARNFEEFVNYTDRLMSEPATLSAMRLAARSQAEATSWERIFAGMYETYQSCLNDLSVSSRSVLGAATSG
jgi:glycosyltransferase involved in cell wall biosynthesis